MDFNSIILLIGIAFLTGTFGPLIGAGGGFILVPVLRLLYPAMTPDAVTGISLAVWYWLVY